MPYYNIVLLPDYNFSCALVECISAAFSGMADGYILSDRVYPHITLGQFITEELEGVSRIINSVPRRSIEVDVLSVYLKEGDGDHFGYQWTGWEILKSEELLSLHHDSISVLLDVGLKPLNAYGSNYFPHITFCRMPEGAKLPNIERLDIVAEKNKNTYWRVAVGKSDVNGQYLGTLENDLSI